MKQEKAITFIIALSLMIMISLNSISINALAAPIKYGKINNRQYYYTISSTKHVRVERTTKTLSKQDRLNALLNGTVNIVCCFLDYKITVPYTLITSFAGGGKNLTITNKSYSKYVFQFSYTTREIFSYSNDKKKDREACFVDR